MPQQSYYAKAISDQSTFVRLYGGHGRTPFDENNGCGVPGMSMGDVYKINLAKTEFREAYNSGDVQRLLSVYADRFTDMSVAVPSFYGAESREVLLSRMTKLFANYRAKLVVSIIDIQILGGVAYDYGWHEIALTPKSGGEPVITRQRYFELWKKDAQRRWRIAFYIDNMDLPPAMPTQEFVMPQTVPQDVQWT